MDAKGRRTQSSRQKGVSAAVAFVAQKQQIHCTLHTQTHTRRVGRDRPAFTFAITVGFFHTSNFLQRQQFYNIFTSKSQSTISAFTTHTDT